MDEGPARDARWTLTSGRWRGDAERMKEHHVLTVGVDGSETSSAALAWAAREADRRGDILRVVHSYALPAYSGDAYGAGIYPVIDFQALHDEHVAAVEQQLTPIRQSFPGLAIETTIEIGFAGTLLVDNAKDADLLITGSHGRGSLRALFLGSVAHRVAHTAPCAAVLVPTGAPGDGIHHVVVGTDGSPAAQVAVDWAVQEAARWGARLTVVHAWDYPYVDLDTLPHMEAAAAAVLHEAAASVVDHGEPPVPVDTKLLRGSPAEVLLSESASADLLVVGARGRNAISRALLGSTSSFAIHHAHCPVVVIHANTAH
jgi:nucleotide-binding universal stress UspA family protein